MEAETLIIEAGRGEHRHQELSNYCEDFHVSSPLSSKHVDIILGAMFMHLNAPLEQAESD